MRENEMKREIERGKGLEWKKKREMERDGEKRKKIL